MLTTSGGSAVLAADLCAELGVDLPPLAAETSARLAELIPSFGAAANPVDVTAEMQKAGSDAWLEANRAVADDPNVDILWIAIGYTVGAVGVARSEAIVRLAGIIEKPIIVSWLAPPEDTTEGRALMAAAGIPVLDTLTNVVVTAALLARFRARRNSSVALPAGPSGAGRSAAASDAEIRASLPLRFAASVWADDRAELGSWLAVRAGLRFVVKGHVPGITHKSDWGGVVTGVLAQDVPQVVASVGEAAETRFGAAARVSVEEEIDHASELLVGFQRGEPGMAPILLLGWGGYYAEALGDKTTVLCVADADLIAEHLRKLRFAKVLAGFRGGPVFDVERLAAQLADLAGAFSRLPGDVAELEINPVALGADGKTLTGLDLLVVRDPAAAGTAF
jgi:acyl-CoA synthetase (NDP forming)